MQMTFAKDAKTYPTYEKPNARPIAKNVGKACVGLAVTTAVFFVDSLSNSIPSEADVFAEFRQYAVEVAAIVILLAAGFWCSASEWTGQQAPKPIKSPYAEEEDEDEDEELATLTAPLATDEDKDEEEQKELVDQVLHPVETDFQDFVGEALDDMKSVTKERLLATLKPIKAELHVRIHNAMNPEDAEEGQNIELEYWMQEGLSPTQAMLEEMVGRALDPIELELEDMGDQAGPTDAEMELQARIDRALSQPMVAEVQPTRHPQVLSEVQGGTGAVPASGELEMQSMQRQRDT
eukprot:gnl/TRDRNA2_/TRDRNA2_179313_c0_seq1.p1 gnl/TRDRNA2_/TRDRNA2_179313_c0~~gnl/TRDRNA2_/TRDRNA2_179313_c0_seq1.p1  ORF type:complete len:293 (+),score=72.39 gnl/TRDRNA2_/TRDRNA2_179313_c0_seq1:77-955(+)